VYKDPTLKGLAFRIHGLAKKLENLPVVKRAARRHFFFDDGSNSDDGSNDNNGGDDGSRSGTLLPISNSNVCVLLCLRPVLGHELLT
jgi:hypothetical protein